jgi:hypothetical protein
MKPFSLKVAGPIKSRRFDQVIKIGSGPTAYTMDGVDGIRYNLDWMAAALLLQKLSQPIAKETEAERLLRLTVIENIRSALSKERSIAA